jgi:hypothetical protein
MKLTEAQYNALVSARDHGNPCFHLQGRSEMGGFQRTIGFLLSHRLVDVDWKITDAGRAALTGEK